MNGIKINIDLEKNKDEKFYNELFNFIKLNYEIDISDITINLIMNKNHNIDIGINIDLINKLISEQNILNKIKIGVTASLYYLKFICNNIDKLDKSSINLIFESNDKKYLLNNPKDNYCITSNNFNMIYIADMNNCNHAFEDIKFLINGNIKNIKVYIDDNINVYGEEKYKKASTDIFFIEIKKLFKNLLKIKKTFNFINYIELEKLLSYSGYYPIYRLCDSLYISERNFLYSIAGLSVACRDIKYLSSVIINKQHYKTSVMLTDMITSESPSALYKRNKIAINDLTNINISEVDRIEFKSLNTSYIKTKKGKCQNV